jgi:hypothetical protein
MQWFALGILSFLFCITVSSQAQASVSVSSQDFGPSFERGVFQNSPASKEAVLKSAHDGDPFSYFPPPAFLPSPVYLPSFVKVRILYFTVDRSFTNPRYARLKTGLSPPSLIS